MVKSGQTLVRLGRDTYCVPDRTAKIVRWLLDRSERIERMERVRITFNCSGQTVSTELSEAEKV